MATIPRKSLRDFAGLLVAGGLDETHVRAHPARGQVHSRQKGGAPGQVLDRPCLSTVDAQTQVALVGFRGDGAGWPR